MKIYKLRQLPWQAFALSLLVILGNNVMASSAEAASCCDVSGDTVAVGVDVDPDGGGSVEVNGMAPDNYPGTFDIAADSVISIEAIPDKDYEFIGWSSESAIDQGKNPIEIKATGDFDVTALFDPKAEEYTSADGLLHITIPRGSTIEEDISVTRIDATTLKDSHFADGAEMIVHAYQLEPAGIACSPPLATVWRYNPDDIPAGVLVTDLKIAYYDDGLEEWVKLDSEINPAAGTISASLDHLGTCAMLIPLGDTSGADFILSELLIEPAKISPGKAVAVRVLVGNNGVCSGRCCVTLRIDGAVDGYQEVDLDAGSSAVVTLETTRYQPGAYLVTVDGINDGVELIVAAEPTRLLATSTPSAPPLNDASTSSGTNLKILIPILVAVFLAIFLPIRLRRSRRW